MILRIAALALALSTTLTPAPARAGTAGSAAELAAARRALDAAVSTGTVQDILGVRARFAELAARSPGSAMPHYWVALSDWRAVPRLAATQRAQAERYCTEALAEIDRALAGDPKSAEAMALRSSLLGMSLQFQPSAMMTLGPEIEATMQRALRAAPGNPRVQLLAGINTLNKPAFVGGGAEPALALFLKCRRLFDTSAVAADSTAPAWGRDDAFIWAGRAAMKLDDPAAARAYYLEALEVTPDHRWVRQQLLPEAEKALAAAPAAH